MERTTGMWGSRGGSEAGQGPFDTPSLALGRLRATGETGLAVRFPQSRDRGRGRAPDARPPASVRHRSRDGRGLSAFDTPSLTLGRLRPTGELGSGRPESWAQAERRDGLRPSGEMGSGRPESWAQAERRDGLRPTGELGSGRAERWAQAHRRDGLRPTGELGSGRAERWAQAHRRDGLRPTGEMGSGRPERWAQADRRDGLRPTGELGSGRPERCGSPFVPPQSPTAVGEGRRATGEMGSPFVFP